jgi:hypothetical protein
MKQPMAIPLVAALAFSLAAAGCAAGGTPAPAATSTAQPSATVAATSSSTGAPTASHLPVGSEAVPLDPADFSADITHPLWPMKPRTRWIYREIETDGTVTDGVVIATTKTQKLASGITGRVVRDTARQGGKIVEDTIDWYAQDSAGNVWYLGEQTAEFENGKIVSRQGSWEGGAKGAQPGIVLPAQPQVGQHYRQEYLKGEAEDRAVVLATDELVQVPAGRYRHALLTKDTSTIEPNVVEYKLYARGAGPALALSISDGSSREELVKIDTAGPKDGTGPLGQPNP